MVRREVRLTAEEALGLRELARAWRRTEAGVLRECVVREHAKLVAARGEVAGVSVDATKREA
jgi:hypothetical protein